MPLVEKNFGTNFVEVKKGQLWPIFRLLAAQIPGLGKPILPEAGTRIVPGLGYGEAVQLIKESLNSVGQQLLPCFSFSPLLPNIGS